MLQTGEWLDTFPVCRIKLPNVFPVAKKETAAASRGGKV